MAQVKVDLTNQAYERLVEAALTERRPVDWQAEVLIMRALKLPFPSNATGQTKSLKPPVKGEGAL